MSELRRYMVRFSDEAKQNAIDEAHALFEYTGNPADGLSLYDDFFAHAATLATLPERCARALSPLLPY